MSNLDFQHVQDNNFRKLFNALPSNIQTKVVKQVICVFYDDNETMPRSYEFWEESN